jgi:hypothetical protein
MLDRSKSHQFSQSLNLCGRKRRQITITIRIIDNRHWIVTKLSGVVVIVIVIVIVVVVFIIIVVVVQAIIQAVNDLTR